MAHYLLCVTRTKENANAEDGITLFLVDASTAGIKTEVLKTMTGQKLCEVLFSNVRAPKQNILGELDKGWPIIQRIFDEAGVGECAWIPGGARWILETTNQYARERIQSGVPIDTFEFTHHKMANC